MTARDIVNDLRQSKFIPTVLLVGNGSSVNLTEFGELIDCFDEVVRFNDYAERGYDPLSVGTRVTSWVLGDHMPVSCRPKSHESILRITLPASGREYHADTVFRREVEGIDNPSSGVVMADRFIRMNIPIYIFGMDAYRDSEGLSVRGHDPEAEKRFWDEHDEQCRRLEKFVE